MNKIKKYVLQKKIGVFIKVNDLCNNAKNCVKEVQTTTFTKKGAKRLAVFCSTLLVALTPTLAFAAEAGTDTIDNFIRFACDWLRKIGGVMMLVGAVMFALSWQREDAEGKSRALQVLMAGGMLMAIGIFDTAKSLFGF